MYIYNILYIMYLYLFLSMFISILYIHIIYILYILYYIYIHANISICIYKYIKEMLCCCFCRC